MMNKFGIHPSRHQTPTSLLRDVKTWDILSQLGLKTEWFLCSLWTFINKTLRPSPVWCHMSFRWFRSRGWWSTHTWRRKHLGNPRNARRRPGPTKEWLSLTTSTSRTVSTGLWSWSTWRHSLKREKRFVQTILPLQNFNQRCSGAPASWLPRMQIRLAIVGKSFLETDHGCELQHFFPHGVHYLVLVAAPWAPGLGLHLTQDLQSDI